MSFSIISFILDIFFPPSKEELLLRKLSPEDFIARVKQSPASPFPFIASLFSYKDPLVSELVWQIKYKKNKHAVDCASFALFKELKKKNQKYILIPIPISKERRKERGYNQCELLINKIAELDSENIFEKRYDILFRTRHLSRQTDKSREERLKSTNQIFSAKKFEELLEKEIILIDDVTTTGSTLKEGRETLLVVGYKNVRAITLAH